MKSDLEEVQRARGPVFAYSYAKDYSSSFTGLFRYIFTYGSKYAADKFIERKDEFGPFEKSIKI